jgi:hypothetical protein
MDELNQATAPAADTQAQQESMDLTINDLSAMKSIIDVASSRGAFKPAEMMTVGQVYNKLSTFLDSVAKQQKAQQAPAGAPGA